MCVKKEAEVPSTNLFQAPSIYPTLLLSGSCTKECIDLLTLPTLGKEVRVV